MTDRVITWNFVNAKALAAPDENGFQNVVTEVEYVVYATATVPFDQIPVALRPVTPEGEDAPATGEVLGLYHNSINLPSPAKDDPNFVPATSLTREMLMDWAKTAVALQNFGPLDGVQYAEDRANANLDHKLTPPIISLSILN